MRDGHDRERNVLRSRLNAQVLWVEVARMGAAFIGDLAAVIKLERSEVFDVDDLAADHRRTAL